MLAGLYLWIKALHIVSVIAWMAGLLYLPRLFVYHSEAAPGSEVSETFKVMELRLYRFIMGPAMVAVYVFGILLIFAGPLDLASDGWFHVKVLLIVAMTVLHHLFGRYRQDFAADRNQRPVRFYRLMNEAPTLVMIAIVILAVVKPF